MRLGIKNTKEKSLRSSYLNFFRRNKLPLEQLEEYYCKRREQKFEADCIINGTKIRKILHFPIIIVLKLWHHVCDIKCNVIYNHSAKVKKPTIYAATHICWDDIEYIFDAIKKHTYLFLGDPKNLYRTFDGAILDLNGCVICELKDKRDRYIAKETAIKLLNKGENLLIFPEGVWNTSENKLLNFLFPGIAEMAIRTNADIVPVAIERSLKSFDIAIGKNINAADYKMQEKNILLQEIRDSMATLKWDVLEASGVYKRAELPESYSEVFKNKIIQDARGEYGWSDFKEQEYHHKEIAEREEVFSFMKKLNVNKNTAFLLRDN